MDGEKMRDKKEINIHIGKEIRIARAVEAFLNHIFEFYARIE